MLGSWKEDQTGFENLTTEKPSIVFCVLISEAGGTQLLAAALNPFPRRTCPRAAVPAGEGPMHDNHGTSEKIASL